MALFLNESLESKYNLGSLDINYLESLKESNILHEKYFGKDTLLEEAESKIDQLVKNIDNGLASTSNKNQNLMNEARDIFKKKFNFNILDIIIKPDVMNAYTLAGTSQLLSGFNFNILNKPAFEITNSGYRFTKPGGISYIGISSSIIEVAKLNAEEIVAIILHEIGHNFFLQNTLRTLLLMILIPIHLFVMGTMYLKDLALSLISRILDIINGSIAKGVDVLVTILNQLLFIFIKLSKVFGVVGHFAQEVALLPLRVSNFLHDIVVADTYNQEKFSDEFAAKHGYASGIASAMSKLDESTANYQDSRDRKSFSAYSKENSEANTLYCFLYSFSSALSHFFDVHPTIHSRVETMSN